MLNSCFTAGNSLCSTCGTNIDANNLIFNNSNSNLVYIDKVFSYNEGVSCPLIYSLTSASSGGTTSLITTKGCLPPLNPCQQAQVPEPQCNQCCCCCCPSDDCQVSSSSVFTVNNNYVLISSLTPATAITAADVSLDGNTVAGITNENGIYTVDISNLESELSNTLCECAGLPTKHFFLINGITNWLLTGSIISEGTVNTGGSVCNFRLTLDITTAVTVTGTTTIAVSQVSIPCSANGISPTIQFTLGGVGNLLNPAITIPTPATTTTGTTDTTTAAATTTSTAPGLTASLVVEPTINLQVIRKTLMCLDASESNIPCDNSIGILEDELQNSCTQPQNSPCGNSSSYDGAFQFNGICGCRTGF